MELMAVDGERIADKTVLKMMREMGLRCGIRRETDYHRYNSYRGEVGETFENVLGRDFGADGPWRKMGTDVTEFRCSVDGERIADKTVLKMMREMGLRCGIRRETDYHRYNSYRGEVGETFENVLGRDFAADGPWRKMGTDVTEFRCSFGKAYLAPAYDFGSREIVAWSISERPDMEQQREMLDGLAKAMPEGAEPVMQMDMGWQYQHRAFTGRLRGLMDMGWQYQHRAFTGRLRGLGVTQSMSRKGNCLDNACTEGLFGHMKDEFFRGRDWDDFEEFKRDLEAYIHHWNHVRRQVRLKGLTPVEFREQALRAYIHHWNHVRRQVRLKGLTPVEFREQALRGAA